MQALLRTLGYWCQERPWQEKVLLVKDFREGDRIREALLRQSGAFANLRTFTPAALAQHLAAGLLAGSGYEFRDGRYLLPVLEQALADLRERGQLDYFSRLESEVGLGPSLLGAVLELRLYGFSAEDMEPASFVDENKGREMKDLLAGFQEGLDGARLVDGAGLMQWTLECLPWLRELSRQCLFFIPEHLELETIPFRFLEGLTEGRRVVLPAEPVFGLAYEGTYHFSSEEEATPASSLAWLYRPEEAPLADRPPELQLFHAYGLVNEVREVLRRLESPGIPWDRALVAYTRRELYVPLLFSLAADYGVPVTFAQGVPLRLTAPGRLAAGLLEWLAENEDVRVLARLMREQAMAAERPETESRWLRQTEAGWGREQALRRLEERAALLEQTVQAPESGAKDEDYAVAEREASAMRELAQRLTRWLRHLPAAGESAGPVDFPSLCRGLVAAIQEGSRVASRWDQRALERLAEELELWARSYPGVVSLQAGVRRLEGVLDTLWVGAQGPQPGHLYVAPFHASEFENRPHNFVVGLHEGCFPGRGLQDPLLLDSERRNLGGGLPERRVAPENNLYRMARFLSTRPGPVTLSFPSFDLAENRPSYPSALFLQGFRLARRQPRADYSDLWEGLPQAANFASLEPGETLEEGEWWLSSFFRAGSAVTRPETLSRVYPFLGRGLYARNQRDEDRFTAYDGLVETNTAGLDPRRGRRAVSPTRLEALAECPFAYFMQWVLGAKEPPGEEITPERWLPPRGRGQALHEVFARFLQAELREPVESSRRRELLQGLAGEVLEEYTAVYPVPNQRVLAYERRQLQQDLEVFLRLEEQLRRRGHRPVAAELAFGTGDRKSGEDDSRLRGRRWTPVELPLPDGKRIKLSGNIDRVDYFEAGQRYRVWDYKTGRAGRYKGKKQIEAGRQLQHALYALAFRAWHGRTRREQISIPQGGYLFPTEMGEGEEILRETEPETALQAVTLLCNLLAQGTFVPTPRNDGRACWEYCRYSRACQMKVWAEDRWKNKLEGHPDDRLEPWKELQDYD